MHEAGVSAAAVGATAPAKGGATIEEGVELLPDASLVVLADVAD